MPARIADIEQFAAQRAASRCAMGPVAPRGALERAVRPPRSRAPRDSACFLAFSCLLRTDGVGSADFPGVRSVLEPAAHMLAGLRSHRRSPQWAASAAATAATARPAGGFWLRSASPPFPRPLRPACVATLSRTRDARSVFCYPGLLRNQLQVRGGRGTAKALSPSTSTTFMPTSSATLHAPCTLHLG